MVIAGVDREIGAARMHTNIMATMHRWHGHRYR
jgi:hypothetical protein